MDFPAHVIQRGNNRQPLFTSDADIAAYSHWLEDGALRFRVDVHGWVFMTNHVHLLITPRVENGVSRLMQSLGRRYVGHFNYSYARSGTLFEGRFRSCLVQENQYFLACLRYIELNPVRAGMVTDPGDYRWSSYRAHACGAPVKFWNPHDLYLSLASRSAERQIHWRRLVGEAMDTATISKIRHCTNTGLVLGTEKFRDQVAALRN
ncbi:MAG TPA: transposase [Gemmatimonadales bacterium]|nr:transposase [Gemmatimonadales bacterium]